MAGTPDASAESDWQGVIRLYGRARILLWLVGLLVVVGALVGIDQLGRDAASNVSAPSAARPVPGVARPAPVTPASRASCATLARDVDAAMNTPIDFAADSATLTAAEENMLSGLAATIVACPGAKITVVGYAGSIGNDATNMLISQQRAKSVADHLISAGVPAGEITTRGAGAFDPIASNHNDDGRARNRRVEIFVN